MDLLGGRCFLSPDHRPWHGGARGGTNAFPVVAVPAPECQAHPRFGSHNSGVLAEDSLGHCQGHDGASAEAEMIRVDLA